MLHPHRCAQDHQDGDQIEGQEDHPLHPDGFALVFDCFRSQVLDGDTHAVDGMEHHAKENKDLEQPVFINGVDEYSTFSPDERSQDMDRDEDGHTQPAEAM